MPGSVSIIHVEREKGELQTLQRRFSEAENLLQVINRSCDAVQNEERSVRLPTNEQPSAIVSAPGTATSH